MLAKLTKTLFISVSLCVLMALPSCAALAFGRRKPTGAPKHDICFTDPSAVPVAGAWCTTPDNQHYFVPMPNLANFVCRKATDDQAFVTWCLRSCPKAAE